MRRNSGFTLVELMVTVGLVSVVAVGIIRLQNTMNKSVKAAAQKYEVIQIHGELSQVIGDPYNCEVMLKGQTLPNLTLGGTDGISLPSINKVSVRFKNGGTSLVPERDASGNLIVDSTKVVTYAGEVCKQGQHNILDAGKYPCVYGYGTNSVVAIKKIRVGLLSSKAATVAITYLKGPAAKKGWASLSASAKSAAQQSSQFGRLEETKTIPIAIELDGSNKVVSCNSEISDINETFCISLGGVWIDDKCKNISIESDSPATYPAITAVGDLQTEDLAVSQNLTVGGNAAITGTQTVTGTTTLQDTLTVKRDATLQSNLTVANSSTAASLATTGVTGGAIAGAVNANGLCIKGACKTTWNTSCASTQYQYGISSSGTALCKNFPNTICPANKYVVKVNPDGSAVCGDPPQIVSDVTCGTGFAIQSAVIAGSTPSKVCVTVRLSDCVWVYSGWVGTTNYSTTARGGTNAMCPAGKFATGARVDTTNSSPIDTAYSSGAVRIRGLLLYCGISTLMKFSKNKGIFIFEGIVLLSLIIYCISTLVYYWNSEFAHDGHAFIFLAKHIDQLGLLSYRDIIEINTIGSHLIYYFIGKLFGFSIFGLRLADILLMTGIGTILFLLLKNYRIITRLISIFTFIALYLASWPKHYMQREYICLLPLLCCLYISINRSNDRRRRLIQLGGMGVLVGLAVAIKPTMILFIPVIGAGYFWDEFKEIRKDFVFYSSFTLISLILPISYSILIKFVELDIYFIGQKIYYGLNLLTALLCLGLIIRMFIGVNQRGKEIAIYFLMANLVALSCVCYLYYSGTLDYFIKMAIETWPFYFKLDTTLDDAMTPLKKIHIGLHQLMLVGDYWPLGFGMIFGVYLTYQEKIANYRLFLVYFLTSVAVVVFAFKFFPYHFFPVLLFGVVAMTPLFDLKNSLYQQEVYRGVGGLALGGIVLSLFLIGGQGAIYAKINAHNLEEASSFLRADMEKNQDKVMSAQPLGWVQMGALKVMDNAGFLLPTKYMYTMELYHHVEHPIVKRKQIEFMEAMKSSAPTYLIEEPAPSFIYEKSSPEQLYPQFERFKREHYEVIYPKLRERTKITIWRKKKTTDYLMRSYSIKLPQ